MPSANPANIDLLTDGFDQDFVSIIQRTEGVQSAEGRRIFSVRARAAGRGMGHTGPGGLQRTQRDRDQSIKPEVRQDLHPG